MENLTFFIILIVVIFAIIYMDWDISTKNFKKSNLKLEENFESEPSQFNSNSNTNTNSNSKDQCKPLDILSLNPYHRCKVLGVNKFMIRDLKTKLWLIDGMEEGFSKFLPGKFGISLVMSEKPDEYLPLRTVTDPNDYLLATYSGDGIRVVANPYNKTFVLQVFIYNGYNVIGYVNEAFEQLYLNIDPNGNITSTSNPSKASIIEIIEI